MSPSQVLLLSQGRTGCHVLERMLSKQPNTTYLTHPISHARPLQIALFSSEAVPEGFEEHVREPYVEAAQVGIRNWGTTLREAQAAVSLRAVLAGYLLAGEV